MKKIIALLKQDLSRVRGSVVACIVAVGLVIVPTLYAWFNIAGSWDPYGNTGNLKVAVANSDEGYLSDLIPVRVNIGDTVVSSLRENDNIDWVFVKEGEAVEGVRSGENYACLLYTSFCISAHFCQSGQKNTSYSISCLFLSLAGRRVHHG